MSPTQFYDYVRGRVVAVNPNLLQTYIHNADLRWEMFLSSSEVLAASTFYKYLEHPIEWTAEPAGDGTNLNFTNADNAQEWGFELEARVTGGRIRPSLDPFYASGNLTYTVSQVKEEAPAIGGVGTVTTTRPLQGQSPYVVNAAIGYRKGGLQLSLLYNVIGPRLIEVGTAGAGDVYEQAFHNLAATWNQKLPHGLTLKISGTNLLNQRFSLRQGNKGDNHGVEIFGFRPGVVGLASLEWSYEETNK